MGVLIPSQSQSTICSNHLGKKAGWLWEQWLMHGCRLSHVRECTPTILLLSRWPLEITYRAPNARGEGAVVEYSTHLARVTKRLFDVRPKIGQFVRAHLLQSVVPPKAGEAAFRKGGTHTGGSERVKTAHRPGFVLTICFFGTSTTHTREFQRRIVHTFVAGSLVGQ